MVKAVRYPLATFSMEGSSLTPQKKAAVRLAFREILNGRIMELEAKIAPGGTGARKSAAKKLATEKAVAKPVAKRAIRGKKVRLSIKKADTASGSGRVKLAAGPAAPAKRG